jgi:hypothetical protein
LKNIRQFALIKQLIMCNLILSFNSAFLLPQKDASKKSELLLEPKLKKGVKSKLHFNKKNIVKSLISML